MTMNYPPIFTLCELSTACQSLLGDSTRLRVFPFGLAPQNGDRPYAVWQVISGVPNNHLGDIPQSDIMVITVECYAKTIDTARQVAAAIRDAIQTECYITAWRGDNFDDDTGLFVVSFDAEWVVPR